MIVKHDVKTPPPRGWPVTNEPHGGMVPASVDRHVELTRRQPAAGAHVTPRRLGEVASGLLPSGHCTAFALWRGPVHAFRRISLIMDEWLSGQMPWPKRSSPQKVGRGLVGTPLPPRDRAIRSTSQRLSSLSLYTGTPASFASLPVREAVYGVSQS